MKKTLTTTAFLIAVIIIACEKNKPAPPQPNVKPATPTENYGPYGKFSKWKSVSGDTTFSDTLTLTFFYTEKQTPCDLCYYQQNYPLWNDYEYTLTASKCALPTDSLIIKDQNTNKKAIFLHLK